MKNKSISQYLLGISLVLVLLVILGCSSSKPAEPGIAAIEAYLQALIDKDVNQMINMSCSGWESQARLEYDSFAAVDLSLEEIDCQSGGQEDSYAFVSCTGRIIASYGEEDLIIELSERVFKTVEEGGEWRMCGYK